MYGKRGLFLVLALFVCTAVIVGADTPASGEICYLAVEGGFAVGQTTVTGENKNVVVQVYGPEDKDVVLEVVFKAEQGRSATIAITDVPDGVTVVPVSGKTSFKTKMTMPMDMQEVTMKVTWTYDSQSGSQADPFVQTLVFALHSEESVQVPIACNEPGCTGPDCSEECSGPECDQCSEIDCSCAFAVTYQDSLDYQDSESGFGGFSEAFDISSPLGSLFSSFDQSSGERGSEEVSWLGESCVYTCDEIMCVYRCERGKSITGNAVTDGEDSTGEWKCIDDSDCDDGKGCLFEGDTSSYDVERKMFEIRKGATAFIPLSEGVVNNPTPALFPLDPKFRALRVNVHAETTDGIRVRLLPWDGERYAGPVETLERELLPKEGVYFAIEVTHEGRVDGTVTIIVETERRVRRVGELVRGDEKWEHFKKHESVYSVVLQKGVCMNVPGTDLSPSDEIPKFEGDSISCFDSDGESIGTKGTVDVFVDGEHAFTRSDYCVKDVVHELTCDAKRVKKGDLVSRAIVDSSLDCVAEFIGVCKDGACVLKTGEPLDSSDGESVTELPLSDDASEPESEPVPEESPKVEDLDCCAEGYEPDWVPIGVQTPMGQGYDEADIIRPVRVTLFVDQNGIDKIVERTRVERGGEKLSKDDFEKELEKVLKKLEVITILGSGDSDVETIGVNAWPIFTLDPLRALPKERKIRDKVIGIKPAMLDLNKYEETGRTFTGAEKTALIRMSDRVLQPSYRPGSRIVLTAGSTCPPQIKSFMNKGPIYNDNTAKSQANARKYKSRLPEDFRFATNNGIGGGIAQTLTEARYDEKNPVIVGDVMEKQALNKYLQYGLAVPPAGKKSAIDKLYERYLLQITSYEEGNRLGPSFVP